ncbi:MAG: sigma-70 family RNA polymerase sigma factor [bacterium]|nr:sigma-70 family RNA polymerase sigma factor [bacterium]
MTNKKEKKTVEDMAGTRCNGSTPRRRETPDLFHQLYREYYNPVYRYVYSLVGGGGDVPDYVQETFIKLYRQLQSGQEIKQPKAWIYRVAGNTCRNVLKRKRLFRDIVSQKLFQPAIAPGDVERDLMAEQETGILRNALTRLPARDRMILTLYKQGLSTTEIAEIIAVKKNSIGKILARSVAKLATVIGKGDVS